MNRQSPTRRRPRLVDTTAFIIGLLLTAEAYVSSPSSSKNSRVLFRPTSRSVQSRLAARSLPPDGSDASGSSGGGAVKNNPSNVGWHRRVLKRVLPKRDAAAIAIDAAAAPSGGSASWNFPVVPLKHAPPSHRQRKSLALEEITTSSVGAAAASVSKVAAAAVTPDTPRGSPVTRITRASFQNTLTNLITRWSRGDHEGLQVSCTPTSNVWELAAGHFCCDAWLQFTRANFGRIRFQQANIEARGLALNLYHNMQQNQPRYPNCFELVAHNLTMSQDDLMASPCIRNGLGRLLTRVLKRTGLKTTSVTITSIKILRSGKLAVEGHAPAAGFVSSVPFCVRSNVGTMTRGHVLTFPNLEVSLGGAASSLLGQLFVPILPDVTLDLGHNARITNIHVDGATKTLALSANVCICPHHTLKLQNYVQNGRSYASAYSYDVGQWLTQLGRFNA